jgi:stearoyl-CoA desaturase (delta-9 desaturase)
LARANKKAVQKTHLTGIIQRRGYMSLRKLFSQIPWQRVYWPTTLFLIITPLIAFIFVPIYFVIEGFPLGILVMALIFAGLTNLSITAGYHRLFAHRSYEARALIRAFFLLIGASAWQGSALKWSADHRKHHAKVDSDEDPYSITKGFWHAHMGWLFYKESVDQIPHAADLERDWMIRAQHKYYIPIAILMSFAVPAWIGYFMGAPWAGLMIGGLLRVVLTQQSTFLVNSLSHTLGKQTYSEDVTARDSVLVAILTHGEGYHNFHHKFQADYRNGIRWYQWDPTKWTIRLLALMGLARKLRKISESEILRARLHMEELRLKSRGFSQEKLSQIKTQIITAQSSMKQLKEEYQKMRADMSAASRNRMKTLKAEMKLAQIEFQWSLRLWNQLLRCEVPPTH